MSSTKKKATKPNTQSKSYISQPVQLPAGKLLCLLPAKISGEAVLSALRLSAVPDVTDMLN